MAAFNSPEMLAAIKVADAAIDAYDYYVAVYCLCFDEQKADGFCKEAVAALEKIVNMAEAEYDVTHYGALLEAFRNQLL
jgi:hypothetical protein